MNFYIYKITKKDSQAAWVCVAANGRKLSERIMSEQVISLYGDIFLRYECVNMHSVDHVDYLITCDKAIEISGKNIGYFIVRDDVKHGLSYISQLTPNGLILVGSKFTSCTRIYKLESFLQKADDVSV